jgi:uncharacterized protein (TIGR02145 family)
MIPNKQIGWSQEENLLWEISRQLDKLLCINTVCPTTTTTTTTEAISSVLIGDQRWSLRNLEEITYANGDVIPEVQDPAVWAARTTGAWCYYENNTANGVEYGKLYNYYAVVDPRGLAPVGWHIPSNTEWQDLFNFTDPGSGGGTIFPNTAASALKETGTTHWSSPNSDATNTTGFTALGGGFRDPTGSFFLLNNLGAFWCTEENSPTEGRSFYMTSDDGTGTDNPNTTKQFGLSVRIIKN